MKSRYLYLASLLLLLVASSCIKDWRSDSPDDKPDQNSQIVLHIKTPAGFSSGAASRSLTVDDERAIKDIWVLAFNAAGTLTEIRQGENLTDVNATTRSFTATLQRSKSDSDTYNLMVLANAEDIITNKIGTDVEAIEDKSYTAIAALLSETIGGKMYPAATGETIPMWGESGQLEIKLGVNNNITLSLLRAVARIDIGVGRPNLSADGTYKWTGKDSEDNKVPFEIKEIYVIKPNDRYAVVPATIKIADKKATILTIPTGTVQFDVEQSIASFRFFGSDEITPETNEWGSYTTQSIYIPEADVKITPIAKSGDENHENRMAIIVGGDYNNSGRTTYYRLDFAKQGNILDVLRNHLYQFNISKVSGIGYEKIEDAYTARSMNMTVDILEWNEADMDEILFDGQYYFSITKKEVEFSPMGDEKTTVTIKTNVPNFELQEKRESEYISTLNNSNKTYYKNEEMGYTYTIRTENPNTYIMEIEATLHNVSNTIPNRKNEWKISANRLSTTFVVNQQYTVLYVSYINGQSQNFYPEGTSFTEIESIPIDIMALVPVDIKVTNSDGSNASDWIKLGDITGLNSSKNELYTAKLKVEIEPFVYDSQNKSELRTGLITVTPYKESPRTFTINQEQPIFRFAKIDNEISRQSGNILNTYVDVITNLPWSDFVIDQGTGDVLTEAWRIARTNNQIYNVDKTNPRSARFDVNVDMKSKPPMNPASFEKSFAVVIDSKYGSLDVPTTLFKVFDGTNFFDWFWRKAVMPSPLSPHNFDKEDNSMQYIFPWHTLSTSFEFFSNNGMEYNKAHPNNEPNNGGDPQIGDARDSTDFKIYPYIFTFNKENNNSTDYYDLYFKGSTSVREQNIKFGLGVQVWKRDPASAAIAVNYKGFTKTDPLNINITNNVIWEAEVTSTDPSFIKIRADDKEWIAPPLNVDSRVLKPIILEKDCEYNPEINLVQKTKMSAAITSFSKLNDNPASREVSLLFSNESLNVGSIGNKLTGGAKITSPTLTFTQYAPWLKYMDGLPTVPYFGQPCTIKVKTNLQSWGVRIYEGVDKSSGKVLASKDFGTTTTISDKAATEQSLVINLPTLTTTDRIISYYLHHGETDVVDNDIKIGESRDVNSLLSNSEFISYSDAVTSQLIAEMLHPGSTSAPDYTHKSSGVKDITFTTSLGKTAIKATMTANSGWIDITHSGSTERINLTRKEQLLAWDEENVFAPDIDGGEAKYLSVKCVANNGFRISKTKSNYSSAENMTPEKIVNGVDDGFYLYTTNGFSLATAPTVSSITVLVTDQTQKSSRIFMQRDAATSTYIGHFYVGTFHKSTHYGERLIQQWGTKYNGKWSARVTNGSDWILLENGMATFPPNGGDTDAENNKLVGRTNATTHIQNISGEIKFRLGLTGTNPNSGNAIYPNGKPRYGMVLVLHEVSGNRRYHPILVRQGQDDDYVFGSADPCVGLSSRTAARRVSPYALKKNTNTANTSPSGDRNHGWMAYPTQIGVLLHADLRHGVMPGVKPYNPNGSLIANIGYRSNGPSTAQPCPEGYRQLGDFDANGGSFASNFNGNNLTWSTFRQSLYRTPSGIFPVQNGTRIHNDNIPSTRMYADGYFDRRTLYHYIDPSSKGGNAYGYSTQNTPQSAEFAASGSVFYNPTTLAHVFIPGNGLIYYDKGGYNGADMRAVGNPNLYIGLGHRPNTYYIGNFFEAHSGTMYYGRETGNMEATSGETFERWNNANESIYQSNLLPIRCAKAIQD